MGAGPDLNGLGRAVADAQDEALARSTGDLERVREKLLAAQGRVPRSPARHALVPVSVAHAAAIAAVILWPARGEREGFRVGDAPGRVGAWLAAPEGRALPVEFRDGTQVKLAAGARARVASVARHGGHVVLERGRAHVKVVHHDGSRWLVHVGPYEVTVTGTQFDVAWDPTDERFDLQMDEGTVRVTGPLLGDGRRVVAGESVAAEVREGRLVVEGEGAARVSGSDTAATSSPPPLSPPRGEGRGEGSGSATGSEPATATGSEAGTAAVAGPVAGTGTATGSGTAPGPGSGTARRWVSLAREGKYDQAITAVEAAGFERVCSSSGASDLALLADAARLAGKVPRATAALSVLRQRFAGSPQAAQAAFTLGRIAFDRRGAYGEAARWFGTYLREAPSGPLAREAAGRRLEALFRSGDASAREAASQYLARYPGGPHADLARRVAGQ